MPLSTKKEDVGKNIKHEMSKGKPQKQAVAIAMRVAGLPKKLKKKGSVNDRIAEAKKK